VLQRRVLVGRARDITTRTAARSALVLAPHPDDETIGCGATIARKVSCGTPVRVVIATDSDRARRAECAEACRRLGLPPDALHFLGLPDGGLAAHQQDLDGALRAAVGSFRPDDVIAPFATDAHPDHRALAASAGRLCADALSDATVLSYPVWFWNRWAWVDPSMPRRAQDVELVWRPLVATFSLRARAVRTGGFLAHKRNALAAHASHTLDADWLTMFFGSEELFFETRLRAGTENRLRAGTENRLRAGTENWSSRR
jgi:LmbE family N-acetylglucosaminyl deacetylase